MTGFEEMLESVPDSYPAFVLGTVLDCNDGGFENEVRDYMELHPGAGVSDITRVVLALKLIRDENPKLVHDLIYSE